MHTAYSQGVDDGARCAGRDAFTAMTARAWGGWGRQVTPDPLADCDGSPSGQTLLRQPLRSGTTRSFGLNAAVVDAVLAVLLAGLALVSLVGQFSQMQLDPDEGLYFRQADLVGFVLILLGTLPLVWRRQVPLIALGLSSLVFVVFQSLGYATIELPFAPLLALYTTAAYRSLPVSASA